MAEFCPTEFSGGLISTQPESYAKLFSKTILNLWYLHPPVHNFQSCQGWVLPSWAGGL